jgi:hypothetical protein
LLATLEREKKLNLSLIHQMLPPKVADNLRAGQPVLPESFAQVCRTLTFRNTGHYVLMLTNPR